MQYQIFQTELNTQAAAAHLLWFYFEFRNNYNSVLYANDRVVGTESLLRSAIVYDNRYII